MKIGDKVRFLNDVGGGIVTTFVRGDVAAVKAATDAVNISQDLYKNGLADFNNVLDAQRSLLTLAESLTISRGNITLNLIALYKALGGGISL